MKTYITKELVQILGVKSDTIYRFIKGGLPEQLKPQKLDEGIYVFTEKDLSTLKRAITLKETGITYKEVKERLALEIIAPIEDGIEIKNEEHTNKGEEIVGTDLTVINKEGRLLVDSREVARMVERPHDQLMRNIRGYVEVLKKDPSAKMQTANFFIENTYKDKQNQSRPCYLLTRKGCDMVANKMTGEKGIIFTATYVTQFEKMEKALQQVYHVSETAIVNSVMGAIEEKIFTGIDERLAKYEENYRPTHANKISINSYIKKGLGDLQEEGEVDLVKERVLFLLNAEAWQDIPYERFVKSIKQVDESIRAVKSFRTRSQLSLFEQAN